MTTADENAAMYRLRVGDAVRLGFGVMFAAIVAVRVDVAAAGPPTEASVSWGDGEVSTGAGSACVACHAKEHPGLVAQWRGGAHEKNGVDCVACHGASPGDADGFEHYGALIATVVTPRDCGRCHAVEAAEFGRSRHARAADIGGTPDEALAQVLAGNAVPFDPHAATPGMKLRRVNGDAAAIVGCNPCHGSRLGLLSVEGKVITADELRPDADGKPTNTDVLRLVVRDERGRPRYHPYAWPNAGIGRLNLDGSVGACSACHSAHDASPERASDPATCGQCHLGPDHPSMEVYRESKHGAAFAALARSATLDEAGHAESEGALRAPTCVTCHMAGHGGEEGGFTHDPGERISWTHREAVSVRMDTDGSGAIVRSKELGARRGEVADSALRKRSRMAAGCRLCHSSDYVNGYYRQYDDFVILYNEKFAIPGRMIMAALYEQKLISERPFDEEIEWTWYRLWHQAGRRARLGAAMMAPKFAHERGLALVAERFYRELVPQARAITKRAFELGQIRQAAAVNVVIDSIMGRPEHAWQER